MHSYVSLAFYFLGAAIKQDLLHGQLVTMAEDAAAKRYALCAERLERDGWYGCCCCGNHRSVDLGDGEVAWR